MKKRRPVPGETKLRILGQPAYQNRAGNPYNALLSDAVAEAGAQVTEFRTRELLRIRAHIWHVHWPDHVLHGTNRLSAVYDLFKFFAQIGLARLRSTRIVWTIHNVKPHELSNPFLYRLLKKSLGNNLSGWLSLSDEGRQAAITEMPRLANIKSRVIPHGHYRTVYGSPTDGETAKRKLDLPVDARILLFFGQIRPYKNVPDLVRAFTEIEDEDVYLIVAGRATEGLADEIREAARHNDRIRLHFDFIPENDICVYFGAADLTILPFRDILNSGSLVLSLSFNTPVLAPNIGSIPALQRDVGSSWVQVFDGPMTAQAIARALAVAETIEGPAPLESLEWKQIGLETVDFYHEVWT